MPWRVERTDQCPASRPWGVILKADGTVVEGGCHSDHAMANRHMAALYAREPRSAMRAELLARAGPFLLPQFREQPRDDHGRFASSGDKPDAAAGGDGGVGELFTRAEAGGFTYSPATHKYADTGYAVSPYPERSKVIPFKEATPADIDKYQRDNADLLSKPGHNMGAWREKDDKTDQLWLDVTVVASTAAAGARLGRAHDQVAMYNLGTGQTIDLGGSGGQARSAAGLRRVVTLPDLSAYPIRGPTLNPGDREVSGVGELRGGVIPGDLPPDEQAEANRLLWEHLVGGDRPQGDPSVEPGDGKPDGKPGG